MWLQIHSIRFPQVYCELLWTNDQRFFLQRVPCWSFLLFSKSCLKVVGTAYTRALFLVYSLVDKDGTKVEDIEGDDAKE